MARSAARPSRKPLTASAPARPALFSLAVAVPPGWRLWPVRRGRAIGGRLVVAGFVLRGGGAAGGRLVLRPVAPCLVGGWSSVRRWCGGGVPGALLLASGMCFRPLWARAGAGARPPVAKPWRGAVRRAPAGAAALCAATFERVRRPRVPELPVGEALCASALPPPERAPAVPWTAWLTVLGRLPGRWWPGRGAQQACTPPGQRARFADLPFRLPGNAEPSASASPKGSEERGSSLGRLPSPPEGWGLMK